MLAQATEKKTKSYVLVVNGRERTVEEKKQSYRGLCQTKCTKR